jgi:2,3-bisphosphoglycerate-dependent phosphoglycerate mutase
VQATTRLILVRHAETEWNREGRFQGQQDSPLTERGAAQAQAVAKRLRNLTFTALYSSDQGRSIVTAGYIQAATGQPIVRDARLRERAYGVFEGATREEAADRHPEVYETYMRSHSADFRLPGGESRHELLTRGRAALQEIMQQHAGETVVIVTHGGFLSSILAYVIGVPQDLRPGFVVINGSVSVVVRDPARWYVESLGDTCHLQLAANGLGDVSPGMQP